LAEIGVTNSVVLLPLISEFSESFTLLQGSCASVLDLNRDALTGVVNALQCAEKALSSGVSQDLIERVDRVIYNRVNSHMKLIRLAMKTHDRATLWPVISAKMLVFDSSLDMSFSPTSPDTSSSLKSRMLR